MASQIYNDFFGAVSHIQIDAEKLRRIVQGEDTEVIQTENGPVDSVAKTLLDLQTAINDAGTGWLAQAQAAATSADADAQSADFDALNADADAAAALAAKQAAVTAAEASGITAYADTYADAQTLAASMADGQAIMIFADEQLAGQRTVRLVASGALTAAKAVLQDSAEAAANQVFTKLDSVVPGQGAALMTYENGLTVQQWLPVDNLKALLDATWLQIDGLQLNMREFCIGTGRGGGRFYWDASRSKADANGGTVFDPDNTGAFDGTPATVSLLIVNQGTGTGTGCWVRLNKALPGAAGLIPYAETLWFGADPSQADHSVILDAWAAVGGELRLSNLTHYYNNTSGNSITVSVADTRIKGPGRIEALADDEDVMTWSASGIRMEKVRIKGSGTFTQDKNIASQNRKSLVRIDANDCWIQECELEDAPQNFIYFNDVKGGRIIRNTLIGGPTTMTDTGYQGIRMYGNAQDFIIDGNVIKANAAGGKVTEAIIIAQNGVCENFQIRGNRVQAAHDHALYAIGIGNAVITGNITETDGSGIVVTGHTSTGGINVQGNIISMNFCAAGPGVDLTTVGLYLRDSNNTICTQNHIEGFPTGIQMCPVQYNDPTNLMNHNVVKDNIIRGCTDSGIVVSYGSLSLAEMSYNKIINNTIQYADSGLSELGQGIIISAGTIMSVGNEVHDNTVIGAADEAYVFWHIDKSRIADNRAVDPCQHVSASGQMAFQFGNCTDCDIDGNVAEDTTGNMLYGFSGSNSTTGSRIRNNKVLGWGSIPIRQFQPANHGNTFSGNIIGTDPLTGTVMLNASATTTVTNDNAHFGNGYNRQVRLTPLGANAAQLVGGASSPYADVNTTGVSFDIKTADGSAAVGDEQFFYEVLG